jgi:hypothetical protein
LEVGVTLNVVVVCQSLLFKLYDAPAAAEAVKVEAFPMQIAVGFAVSDKLVGSGFTTTV